MCQGAKEETGLKPRIERGDESKEYFFEEGCFILELLNSEQDPGVSIARARVEPGQETRLHHLEGLVERYVILAGQGRLELGGLPPKEVGLGDVAVIPPGCPQKIANSGSRDLVFLVVCTPRFTRQAYRFDA
jgi:mannose-6-phosphate isomerase-like protein (cupin superfamily)